MNHVALVSGWPILSGLEDWQFPTARIAVREGGLRRFRTHFGAIAENRSGPRDYPGRGSDRSRARQQAVLGQNFISRSRH
jgi:hypothetical protein